MSTAVGDRVQQMTDLFSSEAFKQTAVKMTVISGPLGMLLDNQHGLFNTLNYVDNGLRLQVIADGNLLLKSAAWVPLLFAFAGWIMSVLQISLDKLLDTKAAVAPNYIVSYAISMFAFQYYLSGLMDHESLGSTEINAILIAIAAAGYAIFDRTAAGFVLSTLTAIAGPIAELILINYGGLYSYTHADFYGICSWIPWVYFLGGTAVGILARKVYALESGLEESPAGRA
jgi:hypothetical protein